MPLLKSALASPWKCANLSLIAPAHFSLHDAAPARSHRPPAASPFEQGHSGELSSDGSGSAAGHASGHTARSALCLCGLFAHTRPDPAAVSRRQAASSPECAAALGTSGCHRHHHSGATGLAQRRVVPYAHLHHRGPCPVPRAAGLPLQHGAGAARQTACGHCRPDARRRAGNSALSLSLPDHQGRQSGTGWPHMADGAALRLCGHDHWRAGRCAPHCPGPRTAGGRAQPAYFVFW